MIIDRAIVATSPTPLYYEFWPIVARGWRNINIEPTAAAIGNVNLNYGEGTIIKFPLIDGIDPGFIAQVIRFIIPCFFPEEVSVTADIDMVPLSISYFSKDIAQYDNDDIVIFSSDAYPNELRYPMCYMAAKGKYFREIIGLKNLELATIIDFIKDLHALNLKWDTDELFFTRKLHESPLLKKAVLLKRGWNPMAKNRLDRSAWKYWELGFCLNRYIDAHCLRPLHLHIRQLSSVIAYVDHGSDGRRYAMFLLKKPLKAIVNLFKLFHQNYIAKNLFAVAQIKTRNTSHDKIIAFSLYGNAPRYVQNLQQVISSYQQLLPEWKCRVYAAKDIAQEYIEKLMNTGCEVIVMDATGVDHRYTLWRFLAIEDKDANAVIIRDLDSICSEREKVMIGQWLASGKQFHIIRDHINHNTPVMAGMWGIRKNDIDVKQEAKKMLLTDNYGIDQLFLQQLIYPQVKDDVMVHDSFPRFPHEDAIVIPFDDNGFVGEIYTDESANQRDKNIIADHHKRCFAIE